MERDKRRRGHLSERDAFIALLALAAVFAALLIAAFWLVRTVVLLPVWISRRLVEGCRATWRRIRDRGGSRPGDEAAGSRRGGRLQRPVALAHGVALACSVVLAAIVYLPRWLVLVPKGMLVLRSRRRAYARSRASSSRAGRARLFVSYRTAQHEAARAVHDVLVAHGFVVWFDYDQGLLPSQTLGLDAQLEKAIRESDVVVMVHGADPSPPPARRGWADDVDGLLATAVRAVPACFLAVCALSAAFFLLAAWVFAPIAAGTGQFERLRLRPAHANLLRALTPAPALRWWYRTLYHVEILPRPDEPWQGWERRIAELFGIPVVDAHVTSGDGASRGDAAAPVVLRSTQLEDDVSTQLVPRIETTARVAAGPLVAANARFREHVVGELTTAGGGPVSLLGWLFGGWLKTLTTARGLLLIEQ